jgi:hypothetical protein
MKIFRRKTGKECLRKVYLKLTITGLFGILISTKDVSVNQDRNEHGTLKSV